MPPKTRALIRLPQMYENTKLGSFKERTLSPYQSCIRKMFVSTTIKFEQNLHGHHPVMIAGRSHFPLTYFAAAGEIFSLAKNLFSSFAPSE